VWFSCVEQKLPTQEWTPKELEMVLSEAFLWHTVFKDTKVVNKST